MADVLDELCRVAGELVTISMLISEREVAMATIQTTLDGRFASRRGLAHGIEFERLSCATIQDVPTTRSDSRRRSLFISSLQSNFRIAPCLCVTKVLHLPGDEPRTVVARERAIRSDGWEVRPPRLSSCVSVSVAGRNVLGPAIFVVRVSRSFRMICCIFQAFDRGGFERLVGIG